MQTTLIKDHVKRYFLLPRDLSEKVNKLSKELNLNFSELIRKALVDFVGKKEKERIDKEIEEACQFYYDIDKEMASEWLSTERLIK